MAPRSWLEIEQTVQGVLDRYGLEPGALESLIQRAKVTVKAAGFGGRDEDVSGFIQRGEHGAIEIFVNPVHAATRQRFTIAHELGHYFLGHLQAEEYFVSDDAALDLTREAVLYRTSAPYADLSKLTRAEELEVEANRFAVCLLMPRNLVEQAWAFDPNVLRLANMFMVSKQAMELRLRGLKLL